jgi:hypothetical protein
MSPTSTNDQHPKKDRWAAGDIVTRDDLMRIEASDLLKSRVFANTLPDDSDALPAPEPTTLDHHAAT